MSLARTFRFMLGAAIVLVSAAPAVALPTMIRLGYNNCAACHISPQGGGPLNTYGRAIDEAQSLRSGEYRPSGNELVKALSAHGRVLQDLRMVVSEQGLWASHKAADQVFRPRLMYRNVTSLGKGFRLSGIVTGESVFAPRPALHYDPATRPSSLLVNTALVHFKPAKAFEIAAGKDQLPTGVDIPDLAVFIRARNRNGYYDSPAQVKAYVGTGRYQVMPFVYAPGGNEAAGDRESGVGTLAEADLFGTGRTVLGVSLQRGAEGNGSRHMVGGYARLGFGRWGILAEHDVTDRTRESAALVTGSFRQQASYAQVFLAVREWLVASASGERLRVNQPYVERLDAGKVELAARLTNQAAITIAGRLQRNRMTDVWGKSVTLQLAVKTAQ